MGGCASSLSNGASAKVAINYVSNRTTPRVMRPSVHVSIGIIRDPQQRIFITQRIIQPMGQRREHIELAGYWEFPGGKIEAGETPEMALIRELDEEVGITVEQARLLRTVVGNHHNYFLLLHYFIVEQWCGVPYGREGQPYRWVAQQALRIEEFPVTNAPLVTALLSLAI